MENLCGLLHLRHIVEEFESSLPCHEVCHAENRVDDDFLNLLGGFSGHLLDVHTTRTAQHHHRALRLSIDKNADIVFCRDIYGFTHQHSVDRESLDIHT